MRLLALSVGLLVLFVGFGIPRQQADQSDSCGFVVEGSSSRPTVTGPDDIVPLVYVVDQPDSPIEIVSVDLSGMWLSVANEQHTELDCASFRVRNRSNRPIRSFEVLLQVEGVQGGGAFGTRTSSPLDPGEAIEIKPCGGGGQGGAPGNMVRLLVSVQSVEFGECFYRPSMRIPKSLGVHPVW